MSQDPHGGQYRRRQTGKRPIETFPVPPPSIHEYWRNRGWNRYAVSVARGLMRAIRGTKGKVAADQGVPVETKDFPSPNM